jgi:hypothetical protein
MRERASSKKRVIKNVLVRGTKAAAHRGPLPMAMPPRPSPYDPQAAETAARLTGMDVQRVAPFEDLHREQTARLARLSLAGVPRGRWLKLRRCDGDVCPNRTCSAACAFGERFQVNEVVLKATELLRQSGLRLYAVTIVDPHYFQPLGHLQAMSLDGLFLSLRRRIAEAQKVFRGGLVVGSVHVSLDRDADGRIVWSPHVHLVIAVNATRIAVLRALQPKRKSHEPVARPVVAKPVTNLPNAIAYATKVDVDTRDAALDRRGNQTRHRFDMPLAARVEHDRWLLGLRPRDRLFFSGMMNARGGLTLRSRRG